MKPKFRNPCRALEETHFYFIQAEVSLDQINRFYFGEMRLLKMHSDLDKRTNVFPSTAL